MRELSRREKSYEVIRFIGFIEYLLSQSQKGEYCESYPDLWQGRGFVVTAFKSGKGLRVVIDEATEERG